MRFVYFYLYLKNPHLKCRLKFAGLTSVFQILEHNEGQSRGLLQADRSYTKRLGNDIG